MSAISHRQLLERELILERELRRRRPPWKPLAGPQTLAYNSTADVIGYGGAAGGGKTDLAIGKALTQHRRTLVVRKNGTENQAMLDRMDELLGNTEWRAGNPPIGRLNVAGAARQIEFIGVPNPGDESKYRGRPHDLKFFDEASEIPEHQVRFLLAWLRTTIPNQRCQALLCFNPPTTAEGRWIVQYFAPWLDEGHPVPAQPGELRWFAMIDGVDTEVVNEESFKHNGELIKPLSRTFIPSRVADNPYLMGTNYMAQLQAMPEPLRSQMLYGDFKAGVGDDPWQVIPTAWVEAAMGRWKKLDSKPLMDSMGVDVARGGADNTVIARRHASWFDEPLAYPGKQTPDGPSVAAMTLLARRDNAPVHIDVIGVGASPYDFLRTNNIQVIGVNVAEKSGAIDKAGVLRFANIRSQLWWQFREALDPLYNRALALPPDRQLLADLCAPKWRPHGAVVQVESREEIIKRLGRSPDWASAYILALLDTPRIKDAEKLGGGVRVGRAKGHDPFEFMRKG